LNAPGCNASASSGPAEATEFESAPARLFSTTPEQNWARRPLLGRQFLHAGKGEIELDLKRLLAAERAVVALGWWCELGAARLCHTRDKVEDRGFRGALVPGGELRIDRAESDP